MALVRYTAGTRLSSPMPVTETLTPLIGVVFVPFLSRKVLTKRVPVFSATGTLVTMLGDLR